MSNVSLGKIKTKEIAGGFRHQGPIVKWDLDFGYGTGRHHHQFIRKQVDHADTPGLCPKSMTD